MQLPAVELHTNPITGSQVRDAVQPRGHRLTARVEPDDRVRTERFDAAHFGRSDALIRRDEAHMLGPHAEVDLAFVALERHGNTPRATVHDPSFISRRSSPAREDVHPGAPDEAGNEDVSRPAIQLSGGAHLAEASPLEDGNPLAHRHSLDLLAGHINDGGMEGAVPLEQAAAQLDAQVRLEVR